jgi:hypothetical protein
MREKGVLNLSANFEAQKSAPIDARMLVGKKADLINPTTWTANDGGNYIYKGIIVSVNDDTTNNGLYILKGDDYTQESSWEKAGGDVDLSPYWKNDGTSTATGNWNIGDNDFNAKIITATDGDNLIKFYATSDRPSILMEKGIGQVGLIQSDTSSDLVIENKVTGRDMKFAITGISPGKYKFTRLTSNGFLKTSNSDGTLAVDTNTYLTSETTGLTIDNGELAITTGLKGYFTIPYSGTIKSWYITAQESGSIVFDIWKANASIPTITDTITASAKPSLSSAQLNNSSTLTDWTTSVTAGDVFAYNVDSVSSIKQVTLILNIEKA